MAYKNVYSFEEEQCFHIYNRTNNKEKLFKRERNYRYFLQKYDYYLGGLLETHAFCLLGNHFHLLVKVKPKIDILMHKKKEEDYDCHNIISRHFKNFFASYSKSINKQENRSGNLFKRQFRRVLVKSEAKYTDLIYYIHANPELHKVFHDYKVYKWSSYQLYLKKTKTRLCKNEVLDWFGGLDNFLSYHEEAHKSRLEK